MPAKMGTIKYSLHLHYYLHLDILTSRVWDPIRFSISCTKTASYSKYLSILKNYLLVPKMISFKELPVEG